jgi:hypothetical protein
MLVYFPLLLLSSPSFTSPPSPPPPAAAFYESNYQHTQIYYSSMYCSFDTLLEICMLTSKATRRWHASMRLLLPLSSITTPPTHHTPTHISPSLHTPAHLHTLVSQVREDRQQKGESTRRGCNCISFAFESNHVSFAFEIANVQAYQPFPHVYITGIAGSRLVHRTLA